MTAPTLRAPFTAADRIAGLLRVRAQWMDDAGRPRVADDDLAALVASTGWPPPHALEAVRRAFAPWTPAALSRLARPRTSDLGPRTSDDPWLLALLAGRIPALAVSAAFGSLAARLPVLLKPPSLEPVFTRLLIRSFDADPALAGAVRLLDAPSGTPDVQEAVRAAPACLAYGGDATVAQVLLARAGRPTMAGAHRESLVIVFREALTCQAAPTLARAVARDVAVYDQSGCLSPHVVLAQDGAEVAPHRFAELLHEALAAIEATLPAGRLDLADAAAARGFVEEARFLAVTLGGRMFPAAGPVPPAVAFLPGAAYRTGPGFRVVQVLPFANDLDLSRRVAPLRGRVQGVAVAGPRARFAAEVTGHPGFAPAYVCAPGRLQLPPAGWPENGVRWIEELRKL